MLYQLSYAHHIEIEMVRLRGLEPLTYGLEVRCSIQLSYGRMVTFDYSELVPKSNVGSGTAYNN